MLRVACQFTAILILFATAVAGQERGTSVPADHGSSKVAKAVGNKPRDMHAAAWQVLGEGLSDKKALSRVAAVTAMADLGRSGVRPAAARLQEDKDADVRIAAALVLGQMKSRSAIPVLRTALRDTDPGVSFAAAQSLWQLGDNTGRQVLLEVLEGERAASDNLLRSGMRDVHHKLQNPKALVAMGAEKGAGTLLGPISMGIPVAKQFLAEPANSPRALTVNLLSRTPDRATVEALKKALWDKDWGVRQASARAAGNIKRRDFVPLLAMLLEDSKPAVRYTAAVAILRITGRAGATLPQPAGSKPLVSAEVR
jgi:HEAT repeat protein